MEFGNTTQDGGKPVKGVYVSLRLSPTGKRWDIVRNRPFHLETRRVFVLQLPSVISWELFLDVNSPVPLACHIKPLVEGHKGLQ